MATNHICKSCVMRIKNKELLVDLMVLEMQDFDIILGMDWLAVNYTSIDYCEIKLTF